MVDGMVAFRIGETVFIDDVVPNVDIPAYKYVVTSKQLNFRIFQLCDRDLIPAPDPLSHRRPPSRTWGFLKRHKVAIPLALAGAGAVIAAAVVLSGLGFKWHEQFRVDHNITKICALDTGEAYVVGSKDMFGTLYARVKGRFAQVGRCPVTFNDVSAVDGAHVWAVGERGVIYFYDGKGFNAQYNTELEPGRIHSLDRLTGIDALDASCVYAVGTYRYYGDYQEGSAFEYDDCGVVYSYDGSSWRLEQVLGPGSNLVDVTCAEGGRAWAVSSQGDIFVRKDSGWYLQHRTVDELTAVCAADEDHVWAVARSGNVYALAGGTWSNVVRLREVTLLDVCALGPDKVWVTGMDDVALDAQLKSRTPAIYDRTHTRAIWTWDGARWRTVPGPPGSDVCTGICVTGPEKLWSVARNAVWWGYYSI
jgi:hypothetical protein